MAIPKIKSATALRSDLYDTLKEVSNGDPQVITHKQGEPVLLVAKDQYDRILDEINDLKKMAVGLSQIENDKGISHSNAVKKLNFLKSKWK